MAIDMIDTAIGGMQTRFARGGKNPTLLILASSKRSEKSFLESHMREQVTIKGYSAFIVDEPIWNVWPPEKFSGETFKVALGNKFLPSEIIPEGEDELFYIKKGYRILNVPTDLYVRFASDIDRALCDYAGISSSELQKYISGARVNEAIAENYQNPFIQEKLEIGNAPDDKQQYYDYFDLKKVPYRLKSKPLYIHLDMSISGDCTGIAGTWIVGKQPMQDSESKAYELRYQLAFAVSIQAPKGHQISFAKNRDFIYWLRHQGFNIQGVSCFTGDTLISTPNGNIRLDQLKEGDTVYSYDVDNNKVVEAEIELATNNGKRTDFITIDLDNGNQIKCTPEHPILTQRGYVCAKDLTEDDEVIVDNKIYLRDKLLKTNMFIENEWFDKYIDLIANNLSTKKIKGIHDVHHIIPRAYFKYNQLNVDNSKENKVALTYEDHALAHLCLCRCVEQPYISGMQLAVVAMNKDLNLSTKNFTDDNDIAQIYKEERALYSNYCKEKMKGNSYTKGRHHTPEEIEKIRTANTGRKGTHPRSEFVKGCTPWNKGSNYFTKYTSDERKEKFGQNKKCSFYNNGVKEIVLSPDEIPPEGFIKGRLPATMQKVGQTLKRKGIKPPPSNRNRGQHWYNNGVDQIMCFEEDCPKDWKPGKLPISKEFRKKLSSARKDKLYYTNGIECHLYFPSEAPSGWVRGKLKRKNVDQ